MKHQTIGHVELLFMGNWFFIIYIVYIIKPEYEHVVLIHIWSSRVCFRLKFYIWISDRTLLDFTQKIVY